MVAVTMNRLGSRRDTPQGGIDDFSPFYLKAREEANFRAIEEELAALYAAGALEAEKSPGVAPPDEQEKDSLLRRSARTAYDIYVKAPVYGLMRGTQSFFDYLDKAADLIYNALGEVELTDSQGRTHKVKFKRDDIFKHLAVMAAPPPEMAPEGFAESFVAGLFQAVGEIAKWVITPGLRPVKALAAGKGAQELVKKTATHLPEGTLGRMAVLHTIEASDLPPDMAAQEALKGGLLDLALEYAGLIRPLKRIPAMGAVGAVLAAGEGAEPEQIAVSGATMAILGALGGPGREIEFKRREATVEGARRAAAEAEAEAKANEVKAADPAYGRNTEILHNQGRDPARYVVVDINDLTPSHLPEKGFARNPRYPENVQERQYETDKAEQAKVIKNAQTYDPAYTVNTDPTLVNGPPAVTKEGVVLGGNSRVMTLREVYANHPEAAERYREALEIHAQDFGISPEEISKFRHPVLVRVVDSSIKDLPDFQRRARLYNEPPTQAMAGQAEGVSKARLMSQETMDQLGRGLEEFGTLREYMANRASRDMVAGFFRDGIIEPVEANKYIDSKTGLLTEEGKRLAEQVIRGRVFEDAELLTTASPEALKKLDLSLPALARLKTRGGGWDITSELAEALRAYTEMKAEGFKSVDDYLAQAGLFEERAVARNPRAMALLRALTEKRPTELRDAFDDMARAAAADVPNQMSFSFYEPETPAQAFERIFGRKEDLVSEQKAGYHKEIRVPEAEAGRLVQEQFKGKRKAADLDEAPMLVLTGGPPGAGKSTARRALDIDKSKFVLSDADKIKADAGLEEQAAAFHEQSSEIAARVADRALREGYHLVYDSLLTNFEKANKYIKKTLAQGGHVSVIFTHIDAETSQARSIARVLKGETKRRIPPEVSVRGYNRSLPTFLELWKRYKDNPNVDFALVDNNVDGRDPILVFTKKDNKLDIKNQELFDNFMKTPYHEVEGGGKYERTEAISTEDLRSKAQEIRSRGRALAGLHEGQQPSGQAGAQGRQTRQITPPESPYDQARGRHLEEPEKVQEELELWHRNAQLSIFEDLEAPGEVSSATGALDRPGGVSTLGLGIRAELVEKGRVDLRGKEARSAQDLAVLAQVYRDPRFETFRIFYLKDGKIVAHEGVSSRLPGATVVFSERPERDIFLMKERMRRLGADGYYLLHNHPSGDPFPSAQDLELTARFAQEVPGFLGHIIIDSGRYVEIRNTALDAVSLEHTERPLPGLPPDWVDPLLQPAIPHPLLGQKVLTPEDVARVGRQVRNPEGYATLIYRSKGKVRAVQEVPIKLLKAPEGIDFIRGRARAFGAQDVVAHIASDIRLPQTTEQRLIQQKALLDVVYSKPTGATVLASEDIGSRPPGDWQLGRQVRDYPVYRVAEDPLRRQRDFLTDEPAPYGRPEEILFIRPEDLDELKYAGNINLERIEAPDDIKAVIANVAELYAKEMDKARRGRISMEETRKLADELGMTTEQLLARRRGQAFNAEEAVAARNLLVSSATRLRALAEKIRDGLATDLEKVEFQRAFQLHYAIQAQVQGMAAEVARALNSFKILAEAKAAHLNDIQKYLATISEGPDGLKEVASKIAALDETRKINVASRQMQKATRWDMFLEAWINGLLSNPVTHTTNTLSNSLVALWQIPERFLASGFAKMLRGDVTAGEALAMAHGMIEGAKDGFRLAWEAFKREEPILDPLSKLEGFRHRAISSERLELAGPWARAVDLLGAAIRVPGRLLTAEDEFFKAVGYRMELRARAYRQAASEGLTGKAMAERIQSIISDPPDDIRMAAMDAARYQTFTRQLEGFSADVQRMAAKFPPFRIIVPFVRTPANIMRFAFERTPLAPLSKQIRADIAAGGATRDLALARIALGSMVASIVATLTAEGIITGGGPQDRSMRATLRRTGWQPYSIKVGDTYYSYARLEPLGALFGLAADAAEIIGQLDDMDAEKLGAAVLTSISRNITSKTYLRGISEFIAATADPDRYMKDYVQRLVATAVPAGVAQIERIADPVYRDAHSILEEMRARVPGYSKDLPPRRNLWGKPIVLGGGLGPDIMSPIYTSEEKIEPVDQVILDNEIHVSMPGHTIYGVPLTPEEYSRFVELAGNELKDPSTGMGCLETLNKMVKTPEFKAMSDGPDGMKAKTIQQTIEAFREMARARMLEEFPELKRLVLEYQMEKQRALGGM